MRSLQRSMCAAILALEAVVMLLTGPAMTGLSNVSGGTAFAVAGGLAVACLLVAGLLRYRAAYAVGWLVQVVAVGLGFVVATMFVLGAVFLALWATAYLLGARIDAEKARFAAAQRGTTLGPS